MANSTSNNRFTQRRSPGSPLSFELISNSPKKFSRVLQCIDRGVREGVSPALVVGIYSGENPDSYWVHSQGLRQSVPEKLPVFSDTSFDIASLTKIFGTTAAIGMLVERGWLDWNTCVARLVPEFKHTGVQLRHLLSHTSGLPAWVPFWQEIRKVSHYTGPGFNFRLSDVDENGNLGGGLALVPIELRRKVLRKLVCQIELEAKPDESELYSDLSFMLLGWVIEEATQQRLDRAIESLVWKPLGLQTSQFRPVNIDPEKASHSADIDWGSSGVASTENCSWRKSVITGQVHDDNCWAAGGIEGHAGIFSTVEDLMIFASALMNRRFLSPKILAPLWTRVSATRTLGWDTPSGNQAAAGKYFSASTIGHNGFTGTSLWIDPPAKIAVTVLGNRVHPSRENEKMKAYRGLLHDAIREDLGV